MNGFVNNTPGHEPRKENLVTRKKRFPYYVSSRGMVPILVLCERIHFCVYRLCVGSRNVTSRYATLCYNHGEIVC